MPVVLVSQRESIPQLNWKLQWLTFCSHIKGVASHKIVTDGRFHVT
jgi:hypothetical protein